MARSRARSGHEKGKISTVAKTCRKNPCCRVVETIETQKLLLMGEGGGLLDLMFWWLMMKPGDDGDEAHADLMTLL